MIPKWLSLLGRFALSVIFVSGKRFKSAKRVALFGASSSGELALSALLTKNCNVVYIVDNNKKLYNKKLMGIPIKPVKELLQNKVDYIIIATSLGDPFISVSKQLIKIGFKGCKQFDHYSVILMPEVIRDNMRTLGYRYNAFKKLIMSKKIALFGATDNGRLFAAMMETYAVNIAFIVDMNSELYGKTVDGIVIEPPERLNQRDVDYIIITSNTEYDSISAQLRDMGFSEPADFADYRFVMAHTFF